MSLKRAVSDGDKQKKRQLIIDTAARLFRSSNFQDIKMIDVAKAAGMAKGTVFLYFRTKEEVFLELSKQNFSVFFTQANAALEQALVSEEPRSVDTFSDSVTAILEMAPLMRPLASITSAILEQNISYEAALEYKTFLNSNLEKTGNMIEQYFPALKPGAGVKILVWSFSLMIGLQQLSEPSEICKEVMSKAPLPHLDMDFHEEFCNVLRILLAGLGC
ncbi:transcriptional regulator, TetR family [Desulfatibacillum alkenivorans DSM 16219]|jgi:AcrR family transcriptional regulator|uniref:Transcriptional regulator, TetR family n=1 Tax=Desulfatibacillum alkenivorans DSM 16219 TaxID=1121393 RepID=A0A1M6FQL3_9BACT|nr:TetR/AcrR family transcriptional regulator [Desulfatibacillum alkenivorans]SHI99956.1 transcriptional regulator, TetR family [Desulfatibacillum alkenivorans DSM 16219]